MSDFEPPSLELLGLLEARVRALSQRHADKIKEFVKSKSPHIRAELEEIQADLRSLNLQMIEEIARVERQSGLPDEVFEAFARTALPRAEKRFWRREVEGVASTASIEIGLIEALTALQSLAPPKWLEREAQKAYRLGPANIQQPLHVVAGTRVLQPGAITPQRFAYMLLVTRDYIDGHEDYDFLNGPLFISEVLMLGRNLETARRLGAEAERKLKELWKMTDKMVASTIHELLVGVATIKHGWMVEMLPEMKSTKTPDLRIVDFPVPAVIECKRRIGLTEFELEEARFVEQLYKSIRGKLLDQGAHVSVEVEFHASVVGMSIEEFSSAVFKCVDDAVEDWQITNWGRMRVVRLPYVVDFPRCRLFSPIFMEKVFGWSALVADEHEEWDGILCEVEQPHRATVTKARHPNCLKWRSIGESALNKKARGVSTLIANAISQIPDGEMGFVYVAYPEGARSMIADNRTKDLLDRIEEREFYHGAMVRVPFVVVSRLYARPMNAGGPDLIESGIPLVENGLEHLLGDLPISVFVNPPNPSDEPSQD